MLCRFGGPERVGAESECPGNMRRGLLLAPALRLTLSFRGGYIFRYSGQALMQVGGWQQFRYGGPRQAVRGIVELVAKMPLGETGCGDTMYRAGRPRTLERPQSGNELGQGVSGGQDGQAISGRSFFAIGGRSSF
jgi:hypothetical protein